MVSTRAKMMMMMSPGVLSITNLFPLSEHHRFFYRVLPLYGEDKVQCRLHCSKRGAVKYWPSRGIVVILSGMMIGGYGRE